jgi:hypothetical protein
LTRDGRSPGEKSRKKQRGYESIRSRIVRRFVLGTGAALAGPCYTGRAAKDAGSGLTASGTTSDAQATTGTDLHPPTGTVNRAAADTATSSQDAQEQTQGQPPAAQQAEGAKPSAPKADQDC